MPELSARRKKCHLAPSSGAFDHRIDHRCRGFGTPQGFHLLAQADEDLRMLDQFLGIQARFTCTRDCYILTYNLNLHV